MDSRDCLLVLGVLALLPIVSTAQSARDAFWSANDLISVTPNPAVHIRIKSHVTAQKPKAVVSPTSGSVEQPSAKAEQISQLVALNGYGAAPHLVRTSESRLGLRCSVLLRGADKEYTEVAPGTVFHSGDHIRLSLMPNESGYLYVIQQGSSGTWSPIYPPANAGTEAGKIEAGKLQVVPGGTRAFAFDQQRGNEKLYVILSRSPIDDIDRVIRNLSNGGEKHTPEAGSASPELEANNVISDAFIQKLASRDLTMVDEEKVDESSTAAHDSEKAIYVVSKAAGPQAAASQVVVSLALRHE